MVGTRNSVAQVANSRPPSGCVPAPLLVVTGVFFSPLIVPRLHGGVWIETG